MTLAARCASASFVTGCYLSHARSERDAGMAVDAEHGCDGVVCESPPSECHQPTSVCTGEGVCAYTPRDGASCDDGDPCTGADTCASTTCAGTRIVCAAAPAPSCVDASTLRTYEGSGACRAGACSYPSTDVLCAFGCEAGRCADCTAVPWTTTTIDTADRMPGDTVTGRSTSIAVDRAGGIHVAYQDGDLDRNLGYAHRVPGGEWTRSVIEFDGGAAALSLALDDAGRPHALFVDLVGHYASMGPGGGWTTERVDSSVADRGVYPSFTVDGVGGVHVSSAGHGDLRYAHRGWDGEWITSIVDPEAAWATSMTSIATDGAGGVHVAYARSGAVAARTADLRHAYRGADGAWTTTAFDTVIVSSWDVASLAADRSGRVHVGYFQFPTGNLVVASRSLEGAWTTSTVDADMRGAGGGGLVSLAADEEGGIHVVYRDGSDPRLHYAFHAFHAFRGAAGTWTTTTVDAPDYVLQASLAVDHAGGVHIAYYDGSTMSVRVAYQRVCP